MPQEVASQEKDKTQKHLVLLPCEGKHKQRYLRDSYLEQTLEQTSKYRRFFSVCTHVNNMICVTLRKGDLSRITIEKL